MPVDRTLVGRASELAALAAAIECGGTGYCVITLTGEAGIGKSALWDAAIRDAEHRGYHRFVTRASASEAALSYGGLTDLLAHVDERVLAMIPAPQRRALAGVMLQRDQDDVDARAIGQGLLTAVRESAKLAPVVIAIDDEQWLDADTTAALTFALRRLRDEYVLVLTTLRDGEPSNLDPITSGGRDVRRIEVTPLGAVAMRQMLDGLPGVPALSQSSARRIHHMSGGNPFYAREIALALGRAGHDAGTHGDLPVPQPLAALLAARIRDVSPRSRATALIVALLAKPTVGPVRAALAGLGYKDSDVTGGLDDAVDDGLIVSAADEIRLLHPLVGPAVITESPAGSVRRTHLVLADVASDAEERVRHRALGTAPPDAALASELARFSDAAARRGSALVSWELARSAWRFTPADDEHHDERLVQAMTRGNWAGVQVDVLAAFEPDLARLPPGPLRAEGLFALARTRRLHAMHGDYQVAMAEADPQQRVRILAEMAAAAVPNGLPITVALAWAREAATLAADVADPVAAASAATELAFVEAQYGLDPRPRLAAIDRALTSEFALHDHPDRMVALHAMWRGHVDRAGRLLDALLARAEDRGEEWSHVVFTLHQFELAARVGDWTHAAALRDRLAIAGQFFDRPAIAVRARITVGAVTGDHAAIRDGLRFAGEPMPSMIEWHTLEIWRSAGLAALLAGDAALAVVRLRSVADAIVAGALKNPGVFPYAPDLIEALVRSDDRDAARTELDRLDTIAAEQRHPWALAVVERARGILLAAARSDDDAEVAYRLSVSRCRALGLRFDEARATAALGELKRRNRQFREARALLAVAADMFDELGATVPAATARADLARISGRRGSLGLTPTEERVVELVLAGATNRQAANRLNIGIGTVEAHLTRIYAKVGVQSRSQLVRHMVEPHAVEQAQSKG